MRLRRLLCALLAGLFATLCTVAAAAQEQINNFDVTIEVQTNGDIIVTEEIDVRAEGNRILRGIFRDLPRYFEIDGRRYLYDYDVLNVTRDGDREPYDTETDGNAYRIRIGDADVFIDRGDHAYEIRYRVKNQVRYFADHDEIYWNATGTYWAFPIAQARATVVLPTGGEATQVAAYTGPRSAAGKDYRYFDQGDRHVFETTRRLNASEGLTIAVGFAKGLVDPPSASDRGALWWQRYGSLLILVASVGGVFAFSYRAFDRVGRDPLKGPVFPQYAPPDGYSPAAVHYIYRRGTSGHSALIATLMNLAVKDRLKIDAPDKRTTELTRLSSGGSDEDLGAEERSLEAALFSGSPQLTLGKKYDSKFTAAYGKFQKKLATAYGSDYFKWNAGFVIVAALLSVLAVAIVIRLTVNWTPLHTLGILALAALNGVFMYLMPAPTPKGQETRTAIEGFKLYLETAEKLQLNAVEVGSQAPPPMTVERYERFLPYAIALGVEKPWTQHFERLLPKEAEAYHPRWTSLSSGHGSVHALNQSLMSSMSSGVSSALPQSSGSSGSGGGGSSGGGGGGGGGGGW